MTGQSIDPDGTQYTSHMRLVDTRILNTNSLFQEDYGKWDAAGTRRGRPIDRVWGGGGLVQGEIPFYTSTQRKRSICIKQHHVYDMAALSKNPIMNELC